MKKMLFVLLLAVTCLIVSFWYIDHQKNVLVTEYAESIKLKTQSICSKADNILYQEESVVIRKLNVLNNAKDSIEFFCVYDSEKLVAVKYKVTYDVLNQSDTHMGFIAVDENFNGILDRFDPGQDFTLEEARKYNDNSKDLHSIITIVFDGLYPAV